MAMNLAISGADGFLGSHILSHLRGSHNVTAITLFPDLVRERFNDWDDLNIVLAESDEIQNSDSLESVDVYVACAFPRASDPEHMGEGLAFFYNALAQLLKKRCKAVINISSQSVYNPNRNQPAKETDPVVLTSTYATAKYCVELSVAQICKEKCVPYTNIRMASLIGPGFNQRFVNRMVQFALQEQKITISDNGSEYGFLDVVDAADGLVELLNSNPRCWDSVYNLGPCISYGITQIAQEVAFNVEHMRMDDGCVQITKADSGGEKTCTAVDASKLEMLLGWKPSHSLTDSVRDIVAYELGK